MKRRGIKSTVIVAVMMVWIGILRLCAVEAKEDKINDAKKGIVEIYAGFTKDSETFYKIDQSCGFVISNRDGKAYVVTNDAPIQISDADIKKYCKDHNISYKDGSMTRSIQIIIKSDVKAEATVTVESKKQNYCILEVDGGLSEKVPLTLGTRESIVIGDKVYSMGFKNEEDTTTEFSASNVKIYEGSVQDTETNKDGLYYIQHSAAVTSDNTGGPVLNEDGYVIGLNDATLTNEDQKIYYAFPMDEIREVLDNYEINYESKDRISTINSFNRKIIWILTVTLVILAGRLIYLLWWKRKNIEYFKNKEILKKQRSITEEKAQKEQEEDIEIEKTMVIKRVDKKGMLIRVQDGKRKYIDHPEWTIGKEEKNHCVISENPAISRKHAKILWNKDTYYIMDLGSVNGTFVNGVEVKGENKIQLHHGDKIVLANEVFEFREEL